MRRWLWLMLWLYAGIPSAWGATRYVDTTLGANCPGNYSIANRNCSGSDGNAYPTVAAAVTAMSGGDIIYIRSGSVTMSSSFPSGLSTSQPTVISAMPINRTCSGYVMSYPSIESCYASTYELVTTGAISIHGSTSFGDRQFLWFEGIHFRPSGGDNVVNFKTGSSIPSNPPACDNTLGPVNSPNDMVFINNEFTGSANSGILYTEFMRNIWFLHNDIHHTGRDSTDHGMYVKGKDGIIASNWIHDNYGFGVHHYDIEGAGEGSPQAQIDCDPRSGHANLLVEKNRIGPGNREGVLCGRNTQDCTIRNNVIAGQIRKKPNQTCTTCVLQGGFGVKAGRGSKIYNNTIVSNGDYGIQIGGATSFPAPITGIEMVNNIMDGFNVHPDAAGAGVPAVNTTNYDWSGSAGSPAFVNAAQGDYRLAAGDARINAGTNLTSAGVTEDFDGCDRPAGGAFDIGAFEFNGPNCGAGGGGGQEPPPPEFDYSLANDAPEGGESVIQGNTVDVVITATKLAGTAGAVTFSAENLPSNTTASFAPTSCTPTPSNCTTTLTLDTATTTPEGTYTVNIKGVSGNLTRTTPVALTVTCN